MKEDGEFRILKDHHQHHHPLLQKGYCHEWISKDGQRLCLYGTIVAAARIQSSDGGDNSESSFFALQVEYSNVSFLNQHYNSHHHHNTHHSNIIIPTHQYISKETAWGGCLLFSERERRNHDILLHNNNNNNNHSLLWRVPDMYTRIAPSSSSSFPTLILYYKTFQLTFTVQPSTIPKAGYGVFLAVNPTTITTTTTLSSSSSSISNTRMVFTLQPNELLDIGVYAPLTAEDWKEDAVMLVTSFIFEFEPEAYSFDATTTTTTTPLLLNTNSKNSVYDITTLGSNGHMELSKTAKQHIPPYVNECPRRTTTTTMTTTPHVHAQYDPQGSLHYLLGSTLDETEFQIEANGQAQEIFVDYGERYEMVRLRQQHHAYNDNDDGMSSMMMSNDDDDDDAMTLQQQQQQQEKEELEYLQEIRYQFTDREVQNCIAVIQDTIHPQIQQRLVRPETQARKHVLLQRCLAVAIVLYARRDDGASTTTAAAALNCCRTILQDLADHDSSSSSKDLSTSKAYFRSALSMAFPNMSLTMMVGNSNKGSISIANLWNMLDSPS